MRVIVKKIAFKHLNPISLLLLIFTLSSCGGETVATPDPDILAPVNTASPLAQEKARQQAYFNQAVALSGTIVNQQGQVIPAAAVKLVDAQAQITRTDDSGNFSFNQLQRKNSLLEIVATGYRTEYITLQLSQPLTVNTIALGKIILAEKVINQTRFLFGGDTAFGRRFIDRDESTPVGVIPPDDPTAWIQASNPLPGTKDVLQWIRPFYQEADWGVLNLETPVTDLPQTPHSSKAFIFFTLTQSLEALKWLGVDYVSLGNNHLYDYLEQGTIDTLKHVSAADIVHSGAGLDSDRALAAHRETINGTHYAFLSATSVTGNEHADSYVATSIKGGGGDLTDDDNVIKSLQNEVAAGYIPIAQLHTGKEYTYEPTSYVVNRMELMIENGAELVIAHHPHVAQGVGLIDGKVIVHGLGNLAFDQDRQETLMGLMARVDMQASSVKQLRLLPVYLEDYRPRLVTGNLANRFLRRIGEFSNNYGALVYPYMGQGWVALNQDEAIATDKKATITVTIPDSGSTVVDLRALVNSDSSLVNIKTNTQASFKLGRDLMLYGDFDDGDTDADALEAQRWDLSTDSRYVCLDAYQGAAALCSTRDPTNTTDSVIGYRNRIRVMGDALDQPNKALSLFGYVKGDNAGPINIITKYYASAGPLTFGEDTAFSHPGGTFDWQAFSYPINMQEEVIPQEGQLAGEINVRALRVFIRHSPPKEQQAIATFDELAVISWEQEIQIDQPIATPHAKDFLRVTGQPGDVNLTLTFRHYLPAVFQ